MNEAAAQVLLVEDTGALATAYAMQLGKEGVAVDVAANGATAREHFGARDYAVVLLDLQLPDADGLDLLAEIRARDAETRVIVITADASHERVVAAMRGGAHDYLVKPIRPARLQVTVNNALEAADLRRRLSTLQAAGERQSFRGFIGASGPMQAVYRAIENVAESRATVFITGESGTGKEVCADAIHRSSPRASGPFVALNCGAIPRDLMESEIFGHVKGAFTGALTGRDGAATLANGGTLFLDEICEMEPALQTKLLRFLQTGVVQRVGSHRAETVDVRVICATNRDPLKEVGAGRFREDLYYRLNVIPLHMPALRERGDDILLIARALLLRQAAEEGKAFRDFSPAAAAALLNHGWPGNVRELQNVVRRTVVLNHGEQVTADMLPPELLGAAPVTERAQPSAADAGTMSGEVDGAGIWLPGDLTLEQAERRLIEAMIERCDGSLPEAARRLGVSPSTLYRKRVAWT